MRPTRVSARESPPDFPGAPVDRTSLERPAFVTLAEIREEARRRLPSEVWNFGAGGAETETTLRRNRRALRRLAIRQDVLVDVREIDLSTTLLDLPLSSPVAVAPMGGLI